MKKTLGFLSSEGWIIFYIYFDTDSWEKNWIYSKHPGKEFGKFLWTAGKFFNDEKEDKGNFSLRHIPT